MLNIINNLEPFFKDCYRRISVREYSRILKISPPTASKILVEFYEKRLLLKEKDRNYLFFSANRENRVFIDLSKIYWFSNLKNLIQYVNETLANSTIILFGSLVKAEVTPDSDIDIVIFRYKKNLNFKIFEEKLHKKFRFFGLNLFMM